MSYSSSKQIQFHAQNLLVIVDASFRSKLCVGFRRVFQSLFVLVRETLFAYVWIGVNMKTYRVSSLMWNINVIKTAI